MARVLAISSHVVRGHVGLAATVPALQSLGHEVWALPTVLLASRPGLGRMSRFDMAAPDLAAMLEALEADGCWPMLDAVFTGYFPSADAVRVAAEAISYIRDANPSVTVLVDPILGDAGRLYIAEETAEAIRDLLVPLADVATPNLFELEWLSDRKLLSVHDSEAAARTLGPRTLVVTSAVASNTAVTTLLVAGEHCSAHVFPHFADVPNGAGDTLAGLFLGELLRGHSASPALDSALSRLGVVLARSSGRDVLDLSALSEVT